MRKILLFGVVASLIQGCSSSYKHNHHNRHQFQSGVAKKNEFWWPNRIDLSSLRNSSDRDNPYGKNFNYAREFKKLNLKALKKDLAKVLTTSQDWWPSDYGNYGPFFIRLTWHSAGTYRTQDGRGGAAGGQMRFEPLNSWPDNGNLDKARRLLWPLKKKYGRKISWADLMVLAGNVALEEMGFKTFGFAGGRADDWTPELVYWGPEKKFLAFHRKNKDGSHKRPLGASHMGLIYVNPEGVGGKPDPIESAKAIRETFGRMAMNDEETVALIAGGHTFGKAHGAHKPSKCVGVEPAGAKLEAQGFGWKNKCGKGHSEDTVTSGLEGAWTATPTEWSHQYLSFLYAYEWELHKSPGGAWQWRPKDKDAHDLVPDAHIKGKFHAPMMLTTDMALRMDPAYGKITKRFLDNPEAFEDAFARAWFKLTHRDMGPRARYVGREVPREVLGWQDPISRKTRSTINAQEITQLKNRIRNSGLSNGELVRTAWASASSFRGSDMRGGANGGRVRLAPQKDWEVNNPKELGRVISKLEKLRKDFNGSLTSGNKVSFADVVVLAGNVGVERAASKFGVTINVKFRSGRGDATQAQTNVESFSNLELHADGFRNYYREGHYLNPINALIDRAQLLNLSVPEMTALVGGLRVIGANTNGSTHGVFTNRVGVLSNDFFVNLLDMKYEWKPAADGKSYKGFERGTNKVVFTASPVDLAFGSSAELRSVAEVYASNDGRKKFVRDFAKAWAKVMNADRF